MAKGTPDEFRHKCAVLDEHCRAVGRDPAEIERSIQFLAPASDAELARQAREFIAAGASHVIFGCPQPFGAANARRLWQEVVSRVRE